MSVFCYILILSNLRFITLFKWTEKQVTKRILSTPSEKVFQGLTFSIVSKKAHYAIIFLLYSLFNYCSGKNYVLFPFQYFSVNLCLISNICTKKPHQFSSKSPQTFNLTGLGTSLATLASALQGRVLVLGRNEQCVSASPIFLPISAPHNCLF